MSAAARSWTPADADVRRRVIETLDRPLLVEAGAGTGKTTLLVDRLIHALACGAIRMPGVVAITFTEKAAAELRQRLRAALESARAAPAHDEAARARLACAARELDRATLSTIHAFAASILRERPLQAGIDPQFRTLDEMESAQLRGDFWARWVEAELETPAAAVMLRATLLAGVRLAPDLFELAHELEQQRDVAELVRIPPLPAGLEARLRALAADMHACIAHAEHECRVETDGGLVKLRQLGTEIDPLADLDPSGWPAVFLQKLTLDTRAGRKEDWRPGAAAASKEWRQRLRSELAGTREQIAATVLHGALQWLERFRNAYAEEKRRRGVVDFQDLLLGARRLVRENIQVRADLAARIDMLCVDEFQDTDPLQAELVLFLTEAGGPATDWRDVRVGAKLFLVGDPKQSIYRFRRADPEVYAACARIVEASGGRREHIVQNFRSRPPILEWVNGVFAHLYDPARAGADDPQHVPLVPLPDTGAVPALWVLRAPDAEPAAEEAWRRSEARALAGWVRNALAAGFPVRTAQGVRPLQPGDIAILFARTSGIEHYEEVLREAGLPFHQEGGRLFFRRQEVRDVLHALAAIDDPHDEMAIVATLRSPLFGATDEDLWLHRHHHESFSYLEASDTPSPLGPRLQLLAQLHAERHAVGVAGMIARLLDVTEARATVALRPHGAQALANLEQLQRLARQFEATHAAGLREFLRAWHALGEEAPRIAEWAPQQEPIDRVRLLTVHMAKGLEFPCVLLANLSASGSTQRGAVVVERGANAVEVRVRAGDAEAPLATPGYEAAMEREKERAAAEERRLLYVAATRARDYLVVTSYRGKRAAGLLAQLAEVPGALEGSACGALPAAAAGLAPGDPSPWRIVALAELPSPVPPARVYAPRSVDLRALWRWRREWPAEHAARLQRGVAGGVSTVAGLGETGPLEVPPDWGRLRVMLAHVLRRVPPPAGAPQLANAAAEIASLHGVPELAATLELQAARVRAWLDQLSPGSSRHGRFGVQITSAHGHGWIEAWLDLVLEGEGSATLVDYVPSMAEPSAGAAGPTLEQCHAQLTWKVLALGAAGVRVHEAGCFDLESGSYYPLPGSARQQDWRGPTPSSS